MPHDQHADALRQTPAYALCNAIVTLLISVWPSRRDGQQGGRPSAQQPGTLSQQA